ncbi:MAG TPA: hypothetical protein VMX55_00215 [candidate division Zixibacteria bacterium]|nr:hypothetical protein [candidate division Zixibacteria bacterium]
MFVELMNSTIKEREVKLRAMFEKQVSSRGRKRSKKTTRVQELILDTLYVTNRLMRSSEIRIAVGRRIKGLSNYLFFSALNDLHQKEMIIKKKNLLNMKYTFYSLSLDERSQRCGFDIASAHISTKELLYLTTIRSTIESDLLLFGRFFY